MSLILRGLMVVIGAAFLFAVANLFVSGLPEGEAEIAALSPDAAPLPGDAPTLTDAVPAASEPPSTGAMFVQMLSAMLGGQPTGTQTPTTAPSGTPAILAPPPAGGALPVVARAVPAPTVDDTITATWRDWMQANEIETGALAIILPDGTEYGTGMGRSADDPRPVMSLSKAITGLCVDQLLIENGLGWDTTLGDIAAQMSAAGLTPRPWNEHITLASLATHTSGLAPDLTQSNMIGDTHGALGLHRRWASAALQQDAITGTPGTYFYSNTNYSVLGVVIEALSGQSYAQACMDRIVTPAGITDAVIEGRYGSLSSYAGWEMSAMDYARFARHWFAAEQPHMANPRPDFDGYSLGYRDLGGTIRHVGRFCERDHPAGGIGALFLHASDGTTISLNWDACVSPNQTDLLIEQLGEHL